MRQHHPQLFRVFCGVLVSRMSFGHNRCRVFFWSDALVVYFSYSQRVVVEVVLDPFVRNHCPNMVPHPLNPYNGWLVLEGEWYLSSPPHTLLISLSWPRRESRLPSAPQPPKQHPPQWRSSRARSFAPNTILYIWPVEPNILFIHLLSIGLKISKQSSEVPSLAEDNRSQANKYYTKLSSGEVVTERRIEHSQQNYRDMR